MCMETSWGRFGWSWWRLRRIGRSLGDVLGALGGVLGALLDILEVSLRALWAMICQDLDRNLRNTKTGHANIEYAHGCTQYGLPGWSGASCRAGRLSGKNFRKTWSSCQASLPVLDTPNCSLPRSFPARSPAGHLTKTIV